MSRRLGALRYDFRVRARGTVWERHVSYAPAAMLRRLWWSIVRGHESELCYDCGKPYVHWWAQRWEDNDLWNAVTGWRDGGLLCPGCFDRRARKIGVAVLFRAERFRCGPTEGAS